MPEPIMPTVSVTNIETLAILVGASHWPELGIAGGSSFKNSFDDFRAYLSHSNGLGLSDSHIFAEFDGASSTGTVVSALIDFFRKHRANDAAKNCNVLLYLLGQGELFEGEFYFALSSSKRNQYQNTFFSASGISRLLYEEARPCRHYLIVDACHSGALGNITWKSPRGACLLASTRASELSLAKNGSSIGRERTQFTGAMLEVLTGNEGVGDSESQNSQKPTLLSFDVLSGRIRTRVERLHGEKAVLPELRAVGGPRIEMNAWLPVVSMDPKSSGPHPISWQSATTVSIAPGRPAASGGIRPEELTQKEISEFEPFTDAELFEMLRDLDESLLDSCRLAKPYPEIEVPFTIRYQIRNFRRKIAIIKHILTGRGVVSFGTNQT